MNYFEARDYAIESLMEVLRNYKETVKTNSVFSKEGRDIVTNADLFIESELIKKLKAKYPNHYFSSEEAGMALIQNKEINVYEWVIDPIDGTINFAAGLPWYSTSICLKHDNQLVVGIVYIHETKELFSAIRGFGSQCNGQTIRVSQTKSLNNAILSFMLTSHYTEEQTDRIIRIVRGLSLKTRGLRLLVSQAVELCLIASGKLDGTVCIKSKGFSSSAGALIVQEAGGVVSTIDGKERDNRANSLLVSNGLLHNELVVACNE